MNRNLRRCTAALASTTLWLAAALPALAADTLDPPIVTLTLGPGESATVDKTLHLDGIPAAADIIVAIDTTGSMGAALAQAQADAIAICNDVKAAIPGARFAAVEFEDYLVFGSAATDRPYINHTAGFTADCATFGAGVATMVLGFGGDGPEANNRVHFEAYSDPLMVATRNPQASQFLVVLADNIPHSLPSFGACPGTGTDDPGRDETLGTADDLDTPETITGLNANDITLLYIDYGGFWLPCHQDMAAATGGVAVPDEQATDIGAFIIEQAAAQEYTVDLVVNCGPPGPTITFSPAPPYGPFTGEQTILFAETITAPLVPGNYTCEVNAVMDPGGPTTAVEVINLTVPAPPAPECPPEEDEDGDGLTDENESLFLTLLGDSDSDDDGVADGNDDGDEDGEDDEDEDDDDDECPDADEDGDGEDDEDEDDEEDDD